MLKRSAATIASLLLLAATGCSHHPNPSAANTQMTINANGQPVAISPSAAVPGGVHQTVIGEVTSVDRKTGEVTVKTAAGTKATIALPALAVATVNKGDQATFDVTITPK